jgi:hypothetical protein
MFTRHATPCSFSKAMTVAWGGMPAGTVGMTVWSQGRSVYRAGERVGLITVIV